METSRVGKAVMVSLNKEIQIGEGRSRCECGCFVCESDVSAKMRGCGIGKLLWGMF